jgi:hypothetical protein
VRPRTAGLMSSVQSKRRSIAPPTCRARRAARAARRRGRTRRAPAPSRCARVAVDLRFAGRAQTGAPPRRWLPFRSRPVWNGASFLTIAALNSEVPRSHCSPTAGGRRRGTGSGRLLHHVEPGAAEEPGGDPVDDRRLGVARRHAHQHRGRPRRPAGQRRDRRRRGGSDNRRTPYGIAASGLGNGGPSAKFRPRC